MIIKDGNGILYIKYSKFDELFNLEKKIKLNDKYINYLKNEGDILEIYWKDDEIYLNKNEG